ncbi:uncharacterized protein LOC106167598 isoform X3 [Lingula anatina]|uniref:Uncharacterized protein LOC106167598 isoform X3 n=1 Tax=Lingula anatina TaxID=7574 RepID=A0A1S3IUH3_LINAN|nr:uncharacterized protein LOC106167598 isoform X3 [Lingula anatina]|eukprot:XP_013401857.1 uncharacterized protein LOC106167598 isoform X3 [Lingula anatina]
MSGLSGFLNKVFHSTDNLVLSTVATETWSRLVEKHHKRVHPASKEDDGGHEDDRTRLRVPRAPQSHRHSTGSSVDLTPHLMSVFDEFSTPQELQHENDASSSEGTNHKAGMCDVKSMNSSETREKNNEAYGCASSNGQETHSKPQQTRDRERKMMKDVETCNNDSTLQDTATTGDNKKRPLSLSSTSSTSTSSLPRTRRKRLNTSQMHGSHDQHLRHSVINDSQMDTLTDEELLSEYCEEANELNESSSTLNTNGKDTSRTSLSQTPPPCSPSKLSYIDRVVDEVLETENTYVDDLQSIIQGYLGYFKESADIELKEEDLAAMFGNIEEIYHFNSQLLEQLKKSERDPVHIAQCFVNNNQGFEIYSQYCTNYPRAITVLTKFNVDPEMANMLKQRQGALQHALPLGSYLLKPVQRILKYHLLLQNILKHFDASQPGYEVIQDALSGMTNMAKHINEMKRKHEHAVRVQEIQSILYGWEGDDLTTFGELLLESPFRLYGAKGHRQAFLFEKGLILAKRREDGTFMCKAVIMCSNLMVIESIPKEPLSFHAIPFDNPKIQYTLQAKTLEKKRKWCQEIKRLILENYTALIPDKAKELVMQLGRSKEEDESIMKNIDPPKRQHHAPEYLEKRRRKSGTGLTEFSLLKGKKAQKRQQVDKSESPRSSPQPTRKGVVKSLVDFVSDHKKDGDVVKRRSHLRVKSESSKRLSRSLESLTEDGLSDKASGEDSKRQSVQEPGAVATSFDDASARAKRISQILDSEELVENLRNGGQGWANNSSASRTDSFRVATELNRVDSTTVKDGHKCDGFQRKPKERTRSAESMETDSDYHTESSRSNSKVMDDGYVNISYDDQGKVQFNFDSDEEDEESPYSNVIIAPGKVDLAMINTYGDYINLKSRGSKDLPQVPMEIIANNHAKSSDSLYQSSSKSSIRTNQDEFSDDDDDDDGDYVEVAMLDNRRSQTSLTSGSTLRNDEDDDGIYETLAVTSSPLSKSTSTLTAADIKSINDLLTPLPNSPKLKNRRNERRGGRRACTDLGTAVNSVSKAANEKEQSGNLWVKRQDSWSSKKSHKPEPTLSALPPSLQRSNSIPSLHGSIEELCQKGDITNSKHSLKFSDTSLMFGNKSAVLAGDSPKLKENHRIICRYATPPRETAATMAAEITQRHRKRIFMRYATPPRETLTHSSLEQVPVIENKMALKPKLARSLSDGHDMGDDHGHCGYSHRGLDSKAHRPVSLNQVDNSSKGEPCPHRSRHLYSRTSSAHTSSESIVGSIKNAVLGFTSKIAHRMSVTSPRSSMADLGSPTRSRNKSQESEGEQPEGKQKEKRVSTSVYSLARTYSAKIKQKQKPPSHTPPPNRKFECRDSDLSAKHLRKLLQESKPGSSTIGARMAQAKPVGLGNYTLPRQTPEEPAGDSTSASENKTNRKDHYGSQSTFYVSTPSDVVNPDYMDASGSDDGESSDTGSVYERELESNLDDVFTDIASLNTLGSEDNSERHFSVTEARRSFENVEKNKSCSLAQEDKLKTQTVAIPEKVKMSEENSTFVRSESCASPDISSGILERLRGLEECTKFVKKTETVSKELEEIPKKSIEERTQELLGFTEGWKMKRRHSIPREDDVASFSEEFEQDNKRSSVDDTYVERKGWVKKLISRFQSES